MKAVKALKTASSNAPSSRGRQDATAKKTRRPQHVGLAPGTLIVDPDAGDLADPGHSLRARPPRRPARSTAPIKLEALLKDKNSKNFAMYWIDITGQGSVDQLTELGRILRLHPLALEDIVNSYQRPKVDTFDDDFFIIARMIDESTSPEVRLDSEQLGMLVRAGLVATFQERPGDCFEPVRKRLRAGNVRIRGNGADYLAYAILDSLVDRYLVLADHYREILENLEDQLLAQEAAAGIVDRLYHVRRDLIHLGRAASPMRDVLMGLLRTDDPTRIKPETELFLRDCYDHALRVVDWIDSHRDFAASLMEVHLSLVGNRTNEAMKVLTIISTIFIPLSFIAGVYGMNFNTEKSPYNMPELNEPYGYPIVLGAMALIAAAIYWYIRRKRWL